MTRSEFNMWPAEFEQGLYTDGLGVLDRHYQRSGSKRPHQEEIERRSWNYIADAHKVLTTLPHWPHTQSRNKSISKFTSFLGTDYCNSQRILCIFESRRAIILPCIAIKGSF